MRKLITLEEGLSRLEEGIQKAMMTLEGNPLSEVISAGDYMKYYDCVYFMCVQPEPHDYSVQLFERFTKALEEGILSRVLPSLKDGNNALLLVELLKMWKNYKVMAKCLEGIFLYLDRHYYKCKSPAPLNDVSISYFRTLVCEAFYHEIVDASISLIRQDRDQKVIDRDLLKNVSTFFLEIGEQGKTKYYDLFETAILADTASYYRQIAPEWLALCSSADYVLKVQWCLNQEKERAREFLFQSSVDKLLQIVQWHLTGELAEKLAEKQKTENHNQSEYQEIISRCTSLNLEDEIPEKPPQIWPMSK